MQYNPNIHHRKTIRLQHYNYAAAGSYFITICCFENQPIFGKIINGEMILNENGKIAQQEWLNTVNKRKGIEIDEFIIMPNHMHGILNFINELSEFDDMIKPRFNSPKNNLGSIIRGYKSSVSSKIGLGYSVWQRNYHEHIIRNEQSYNQIEEYIICNPIFWKKDCFYIER
ncbi:transposase [Lonepinella koalarum]|uniref:transposase n=1 Tax=Lonepinella koalarum TaxID=53417 RepID=UPI003F6E0F92